MWKGTLIAWSGRVLWWSDWVDYKWPHILSTSLCLSLWNVTLLFFSSKDRLYFSSLCIWLRLCGLLCQWDIGKWGIIRVLKSSCILGFPLSCYSFYPLSKPGLVYWMMRDWGGERPQAFFQSLLGVCEILWSVSLFSSRFEKYQSLFHRLFILPSLPSGTPNYIEAHLKLVQGSMGLCSFFPPAFILSEFLPDFG